MKNKNADRRSFLKNAALLGIGIPGAISISSAASAGENKSVDGMQKNATKRASDTSLSKKFSIIVICE